MSDGEVLYQCETVYNRDCCRVMAQAHFQTFGKPSWKTVGLVSVSLFAAGAFYFQYVSGLSGKGVSPWDYGGLFLLIFFTALYIKERKGQSPGANRKMGDKILRNMDPQSIQTQYLFYEDHFCADSAYSKVDTNYDAVCKVVEVGAFKVLFLSKSQAHVVVKNGISKGNWEEFSRFLQGKCGGSKK